MKAKVNEITLKVLLAYSSILIIFIPYGGEGYYKFTNLIILTFQVGILMFFFGRFSISTEMKNLTVCFSFLFLFQVFSNAYVAIVVGLDFTYSDLSEFIRTFQIILPILCLTGLKNLTQEHSKNIVYILVIISFFHAVLMFAPKVTTVFDSLVEVYGEGHYYTAGYSRYRGFGIIGQPGKAGMFGVICIIISLLHHYIFNSNKVAVLLVIVFSFMAIGMSLSRISLILSFFAFFYLIPRFKTKVALIVVFLICVFSFVLKNTELVETLFRGIDLDSGKYATASHRMVLKSWALDFISQRLDTMLLGVGDTKDYIAQFKHPYAFDLSLRTPDSSQTVWLVRFGLIGVLVGYAPLIYMSCCITLSNLSIRDKLYISIVPVYIFTLSFLDPFYHDSKICIIAAVLYFYFFTFLHRKEANNEDANCRT